MQNAFDDLEDDSHSVDNSYYDSSQGELAGYMVVISIARFHNV